MDKNVNETFCLDGRCTTIRVKTKPIQHDLIDGSTTGESEVQNPLQNPLIFHHVLSYLNNLEDLKNCRLVHSTWTDEASNFLKKRSIIKVTKDFLKTSKHDINGAEVLRQLELFRPQNLLLFPSPLSPHRYHKNDFSSKSWGIVKNQIEKLSDGVKCLKFPYAETYLYHGSRIVGIQSFTEILHYNFPNLVQLILGDSDFSWPDPPPAPIHSLKRIDWNINCKPSEDERSATLKLLEGAFKLAPNLEALNLQWYSYYNPPESNLFLDHLNSHPTSCPNLIHLNLCDTLSPMDIVALSNLKIKLRSLKLKLPTSTNYQKLQDFLKRQNQSLERLRLVLPVPGYADKVAPHFAFPCLPKLKKLKLVHDASSFRMTLEGVDYAKQFPVLQKLGIKYIRSSGDVKKDRIWLLCPAYRAFLPFRPEDLDKEVCKTLLVLKLPYPDQPELRLEDDFLFGIRERLSIKFPNVHNEHLNIGRARVVAGHPHWPPETFPVCRFTRSKTNPVVFLAQN